MPFFEQAHNAVRAFRAQGKALPAQDIVETILRIDGELEIMLLNHVMRRASKAQGIALLTLYTRAFAASSVSNPILEDSKGANTQAIDDLLNLLKVATRRPARMQGHLPICFAVITGALGMSLSVSGGNFATRGDLIY